MRRFLLGFGVCLLVGCGSRTGLFAGEAEEISPGEDAGGPDAPSPRRDAGLDAPRPSDAYFPDVRHNDICLDGGTTLVYLLTDSNELYSFYPPDATFTRIGVLACPGSPSPWSMTVDRRGIAYAVFEDGSLFRVDTASAACEATTFAPDQASFLTFGMGYVADTADPGETLYVSDSNFTGPSLGLASIDATTYALHAIGPFDQTIPRSELTGTSDGRLFAYWPDPTLGVGSHISEIDKATAHVMSTFDLTVGTSSDAFAFAYWGGNFWIFTSPGGTGSTVTRFDPSTKTESTISTTSIVIVGAGVSTCAPE